MRWACRGKRARRSAAVGLSLALAAVAWAGMPGRVAAQAINPKAFKERFDKARQTADVVADVRVVAAACTSAEDAGGGTRKVTLELCLHVLKAEKGPAKSGELLLVTHQVSWNSGPKPVALYGRQGTLRSFPCVAGVRGEVALRWDEQRRCYTSVAGWVPELPKGAPPTEAGKVTTAAEPGQP
jgi:hypothetical protein